MPKDNGKSRTVEGVPWGKWLLVIIAYVVILGFIFWAIDALPEHLYLGRLGWSTDAIRYGSLFIGGAIVALILVAAAKKRGTS